MQFRSADAGKQDSAIKGKDILSTFPLFEGMTPGKAGFSLYFSVWLALVLLPAAWAVLVNGGYAYLVNCLERLLY